MNSHPNVNAVACKSCLQRLAYPYYHECPALMSRARQRFEDIASNPYATKEQVRKAREEYDKSNVIGSA